MNIDFLKPYLGDELFSQVTEKLDGVSGLTLANIADGSYVPKSKFDNERNKNQTLASQLTELNDQLSAANEKIGTLDSLNQQISQLTQDVADRDGKIASLSLDYDIKDALRAAKVKDVDIVFGLLDKGKITTAKDGKLKGADEQISALKQSKSFLFETDEKPGGSRGGFDGRQDILGSGTGEGSNSAVNNAIRQMAGRP